MQQTQIHITTKDTLKVCMDMFWEYDKTRIDWQLHAEGIIQRVLERGTREEWNELARFYTKERISNSLKSRIKFLPDEILAQVCEFFQLKPEDTKSYTWKRVRNRHWM